jgi:hypothetical protein
MRITGLINWYDASDPNGNGIIPSNGATISTWVDKSTYANNMIAQGQYNEVYVSTYATYATNSQNGLGTINFNSFLIQWIILESRYRANLCLEIWTLFIFLIQT